MIGAALVKAGMQPLLWPGILKTASFIFIAPLLGMAFGAALMLIVSWMCFRQTPRRVDKWFRRLQLVSSAAYSMGHGGNDAQKTMGIIWLLLIANGVTTKDHLPTWVVISCFLAIGIGTMFGGWRIVKTMGQRITKLKPVGGFAAECARFHHAVHGHVLRHSGFDHAHHHRRHHRRGHHARHFGRALGRRGQHRHRLDHHHPRLGGHRRAGVVDWRPVPLSRSRVQPRPGIVRPRCTAGRARNCIERALHMRKIAEAHQLAGAVETDQVAHHRERWRCRRWCIRRPSSRRASRDAGSTTRAAAAISAT